MGQSMSSVTPNWLCSFRPLALRLSMLRLSPIDICWPDIWLKSVGKLRCGWPNLHPTSSILMVSDSSGRTVKRSQTKACLHFDESVRAESIPKHHPFILHANYPLPAAQNDRGPKTEDRPVIRDISSPVCGLRSNSLSVFSSQSS